LPQRYNPFHCIFIFHFIYGCILCVYRGFRRICMRNESGSGRHGGILYTVVLASCKFPAVAVCTSLMISWLCFVDVLHAPRTMHLHPAPCTYALCFNALLLSLHLSTIPLLHFPLCMRAHMH